MAGSASLSWNLDRSTGTTISVAKDVIRAATSDDVQALALLACERFGATIVRLSFHKVLLVCNFLALAATLVSSVELPEGADAVSMMLAASAGDKTLLPTARQLKDLLAVTEHRFNRSGFTDLCVGYQIMLRATPRISAEQRGDWQYLDFYSKHDGIAKLVDASRELSRVGEATAVTIQAGSCVPWVMAFTRWCLGIPPSLFLEDGTMLLDQPDSRVSVLANIEKEVSTFDITISKAIDSPGNCWSQRPVSTASRVWQA